MVAVTVLLFEEGMFAFHQGPVQVTRAIADRGDAFLLEMARQIDELRERHASDDEATRGDLSEEASLVLRRRAMENLRDLFSTVAKESATPNRPLLDLAVLQAEPASLGVEAVYLRPGQPAAARRGRRMVQMWPEIVTTESLIDWLKSVTPESLHHGLEANDEELIHTLRAEDGSWLDIAAFHESSQLACVVRIVAESVDEPEEVGLNPALIEPFLKAPRGLLVLAGPGGRWRARVFSALITLAARKRGGLIVTLEKQRYVRMDQPDQYAGGVALFQRAASSDADMIKALGFAREQEADLIAANPMSSVALGELHGATWPAFVIGAVTANGAIDGLRAVRTMCNELPTASPAEWLGKNLVGVIATGSLKADSGVRPVTEVLAGGGAAEELLVADRLGELELAFMTGRLAGSISLSQLAGRYAQRAA
jgi:Tfp pilus assembly pilus retraction ATPase PilT